jgi:iron(II)-dependent oxidoreductase
MEVGPFYIDRFPVTCGNYSAYLHATGYCPTDAHNWLKNWRTGGAGADGSTGGGSGSGSGSGGGGSSGCTPPALPVALRDVPVTNVGLFEARAYCQWAHGGSRLPHSYEWQYAAQGSDGRKYPWGSDRDQSRFPTQHSGSAMPGAEAVGRYSPRGDSPFGVSDLVGNIWQFTDEFADNHTRMGTLRGGSNYAPRSSASWYYPQALELDKQNSYLLMDSSYERSGTVGFRCLKDASSTSGDSG